MDGGRFDALARVFGSVVDRRGAARALGGGALAGLGLVVGGHNVEAKKKKKTCKKPKIKCGKKCCAKGLFCNSGRCSATPCNAGNSVCANNPSTLGREPLGGLCICVPLVQGGFAAAFFAEGSACPVASECSTNAECAAGEVCFKANRNAGSEECCPEGETLGDCVPACDLRTVCNIQP